MHNVRNTNNKKWQQNWGWKASKDVQIKAFSYKEITLY